MKKIIARKGDDIANYSDEEKRIAFLSFQMQLMSSAAEGNNILRIVPPQWQSDQGDWHAPWELLQKGEGSPQTAELMSEWKKMGEAWLAQDKKAWDQHSANAYKNALILSHQDDLSRKLLIEKLQNCFAPLKISLGFYILALTFILAAFASSY